jgi:ribosome-associated protein
MASDVTPGNGNAAVAQECILRRLWLKDLSFESPHVPGILYAHEKPQLEYSVAIGYTLSPHQEGTFDVTLTVTVTAMGGSTTLFLIEVQQGGTFELRGYTTADEIKTVLRTQAPAAMFPTSASWWHPWCSAVASRASRCARSASRRCTQPPRTRRALPDERRSGSPLPLEPIDIPPGAHLRQLLCGRLATHPPRLVLVHPGGHRLLGGVEPLAAVLDLEGPGRDGPVDIGQGRLHGEISGVELVFQLAPALLQLLQGCHGACPVIPGCVDRYDTPRSQPGRATCLDPMTGAPGARRSMSRKSRKGYYVEGEFITRGTEQDRQVRAEFKGTDAASRTERKQESEALQGLGEELVNLRSDLADQLPLTEKLREALVEARRITSLEGLRRQRQFIGKLMRRQAPGTLEAIAAALKAQHGQSARDTEALHRVETWRDGLIADDGQVGLWLSEFPGTDAQHLRALVRQARKDARPAVAGAPVRHGRAYREIFRLVREELAGREAPGDDEP